MHDRLFNPSTGKSELASPDCDSRPTSSAAMNSTVRTRSATRTSRFTKQKCVRAENVTSGAKNKLSTLEADSSRSTSDMLQLLMVMRA